MKDLQPGSRLGWWTVVASAPRKHGIHRTTVICDCGVQRDLCTTNLVVGHSRSCGCQKSALLSASRGRHGQARTNGFGGRAAEYRIWSGMKKRCLNPAHRFFANYGGRGITVCDRWRESFTAFIADIGDRPSPAHSVDRIDNDGHYEPGNVRWATRQQQGRNTSTTHRVSAFGECLCLVEWAERHGVAAPTIRRRLSRGWDAERAIITPPAAVGPRRAA